MGLEIKIIGHYQNVVWHVGEKLPIYMTPFLIGNSNMYIQADGDELIYILNKFTGISKLRVDSEWSLHDNYTIKPKIENGPRVYIMCWFGDDAKFIIANL